MSSPVLISRRADGSSFEAARRPWPVALLLTGAMLGGLAGLVGVPADQPVAGAILAQPTQGDPVIDQTTCTEPWAGTVGFAGATQKAQTFVAGIDGRLAYVDLPGTNGGGTSRLQLWLADACGVVTGRPIATSEIRAGTRFAFAELPSIGQGERYALVASDVGGSRYAWAYSSRHDCYADRRSGPFTSLDGGQTWSRDQVDFFFTTWMIAEAPSSTPAADTDGHAVAGPATAADPLPRAALAPGAPSSRGDASVGHSPSWLESGDDGTPDRSVAALHAALASAADRPPAAMTRTAFVIALPTGNSDPTMLLAKSKDLSAAIREASAFHGYADPDAQPALEYAIYEDTVFAEATMPPRCGTDYDLGTLFEKYHLCSLIQQGRVDEVWFWEGGQGGLPEFAVSGPEFEIVGGTGMPNCGRQAALMVYHNGIDLGYALHSLGHRMEMTMRQYRPCDFTSATWPWPQGSAGCRDGSASDATGFVVRPFAGNGLVGACGDVHWPPNIAAGMPKEYDYANPATARSICQDWRRDGKAAVTEISCATWGCSQLGYMLWWMQNLPGVDNTSRDRVGAPMPNWWPLLFGTRNPTPAPPDATATSTSSAATATPTAPGPSATSSPTATSSATPTALASPTATSPPLAHQAYFPCAWAR